MKKTSISSFRINGGDRDPRYGGEERTLILAGEHAARATEIAEGIRGDVEHLHFEAHVTLKSKVSLGVAEAGDQRDSADLVKRADAFLYRAKNEGRKCVRSK